MDSAYRLKYKENKNVKCISCGVLIWPDSKTRLCRSCYVASNPKPNWKGGVSRKYKKCVDCGGPLGDYYSVRCNVCDGISRMGSEHWNWQGGKTTLSRLIRRLKVYREWRKEVFERDNYTCQECGKKGCVLEAHHIKEFYILLNEFTNKYNHFSVIEDVEKLSRLAMTHEPLWHVDNGKTLCEECHSLTKCGCPKKEGI